MLRDVGESSLRQSTDRMGLELTNARLNSWRNRICAADGGKGLRALASRIELSQSRGNGWKCRGQVVKTLLWPLPVIVYRAWGRPTLCSEHRRCRPLTNMTLLMMSRGLCARDCRSTAGRSESDHCRHGEGRKGSREWPAGMRHQKGQAEQKTSAAPPAARV